MREDRGIEVVILCGGRATRCRDKLERPLAEIPMVVRAYRNVCGEYPVVLCQSRPFRASVAAQLGGRIVFDRSREAGPLAALRSALPFLRERRAFIVAADMPFVHLGVLRELRERWRVTDEAIVALGRDGNPQPLLGLYDRPAFMRAAAALNGKGAGVKDVLRRLKWRGAVLQDEDVMLNVNTEADYAAALRRCARVAVAG